MTHEPFRFDYRASFDATKLVNVLQLELLLDGKEGLESIHASLRYTFI
jgi:hypothetical protein